MRHTFLFNGIRANVAERVMADYGHPIDRWWNHGACRGHDPNLWFPEWPKPNEYRQARKICATCPVRKQCLDDALKRETGSLRYGMFGGTTPLERERISENNGHPQANPQGSNNGAMAASRSVA